jgi:hypothetical protein
MDSYEGPRRECDNCGHVTNVFAYYETCDMNICEDCDHTCVDPSDAIERIAGPRKCASCASPARWDSIYCSDRCKDAFLRSLSVEAA